MAKEKENTGAQNAIVPADKRQLQRQPDESEKAHRARVAYCKLAPSQRTIAAAYRVFKGMEPDAEVKVPGYFGAWAKRFRWKEYAIAWDAYFNDIVATRRDEQMAAARRETVEQAEELQTLIKQEIERLKEAGQRRRLWPGASEDRTADLSHLATALKDASAARLAALEGIAPDLD